MSNLVEAHFNLGSAYEKQGKYDLAIESHKKAIAIDSDSALAHYNLGNAYALQENHDLAIESFKRAISINPHLESPVLRWLIKSQQTSKKVR